MTTTDIRRMNADEDYGFDISGFIHLQPCPLLRRMVTTSKNGQVVLVRERLNIRSFHLSQYVMRIDQRL